MDAVSEHMISREVVPQIYVIASYFKSALKRDGGELLSFVYAVP